MANDMEMEDDVKLIKFNVRGYSLQHIPESKFLHIESQNYAFPMDITWVEGFKKIVKIDVDPTKYYIRRSCQSSPRHDLTEQVKSLMDEYNVKKGYYTVLLLKKGTVRGPYKKRKSTNMANGEVSFGDEPYEGEGAVAFYVDDEDSDEGDEEDDEDEPRSKKPEPSPSPILHNYNTRRSTLKTPGNSEDNWNEMDTNRPPKLTPQRPSTSTRAISNGLPTPNSSKKSFPMQNTKNTLINKGIKNMGKNSEQNNSPIKNDGSLPQQPRKWVNVKNERTYNLEMEKIKKIKSEKCLEHEKIPSQKNKNNFNPNNANKPLRPNPLSDLLTDTLDGDITEEEFLDLHQNETSYEAPPETLIDLGPPPTDYNPLTQIYKWISNPAQFNMYFQIRPRDGSIKPIEIGSNIHILNGLSPNFLPKIVKSKDGRNLIVLPEEFSTQGVQLFLKSLFFPNFDEGTPQAIAFEVLGLCEFFKMKKLLKTIVYYILDNTTIGECFNVFSKISEFEELHGNTGLDLEMGKKVLRRTIFRNLPYYFSQCLHLDWTTGQWEEVVDSEEVKVLKDLTKQDLYNALHEWYNHDQKSRFTEFTRLMSLIFQF